jgi:hypothetical protein
VPLFKFSADSIFIEQICADEICAFLSLSLALLTAEWYLQLILHKLAGKNYCQIQIAKYRLIRLVDNRETPGSSEFWDFTSPQRGTNYDAHAGGGGQLTIRMHWHLAATAHRHTPRTRALRTGPSGDARAAASCHPPLFSSSVQSSHPTVFEFSSEEWPTPSVFGFSSEQLPLCFLIQFKAATTTSQPLCLWMQLSSWPSGSETLIGQFDLNIWFRNSKSDDHQSATIYCFGFPSQNSKGSNTHLSLSTLLHPKSRALSCTIAA